MRPEPVPRGKRAIAEQRLQSFGGGPGSPASPLGSGPQKSDTIIPRAVLRTLQPRCGVAQIANVVEHQGDEAHGKAVGPGGVEIAGIKSTRLFEAIEGPFEFEKGRLR